MIFSPLKSGKSVEGNEITAFKTEKKSPKYIYLMAGVHGDEVEGVYVLKKLFEWLKEETDIEIPLLVIPIVNVDGHITGTRVNSGGVDLNRNLPTSTWDPDFKESKYNPGPQALSEPENKYLDKLFNRYKPSFIITFHSWKPILNFNSDCKSIAEFIASYNKYPVSGDIGYPTPGSLGTYAPEKYQAPVLTYECPRLDDSGMSLEEIWNENEEGLKALLRSELIKAL